MLTDESGRECYLNKTHGNVKIYEGIYKDKNTGDTRDTNFLDVINSEYHPITQKDLVNPADKDLKCKDADEIEITIYRDSDYVYYYSVNKSEFGCLKNNGEIELKDGSKVKYPTVITNLPEGIVCE